MRNVLKKLFFPVLVFFVILPLPLWGLSGLSDILLRLPRRGSGSALLGLFLICAWGLGTSALGTFLFARRCLSGLAEGAWILWGSLPAAVAYAVLPLFGTPLTGVLILFLWSGLFGLVGLPKAPRRAGGLDEKTNHDVSGEK